RARLALVLTAVGLLATLTFEVGSTPARAAARRHHSRRHGLTAAGLRSGGDPEDPPEVTVGERLFLETRFAQYFFAHFRGVNQPLASGDPVVDTTATTAAPLPGAFAGRSINCRACHLVDDVAAFPGGRVSTYADFARRSPIPERDDRRLETPRNSPPLVGA